MRTEKQEKALALVYARTADAAEIAKQEQQLIEKKKMLLQQVVKEYLELGGEREIIVEEGSLSAIYKGYDYLVDGEVKHIEIDEMDDINLTLKDVNTYNEFEVSNLDDCDSPIFENLTDFFIEKLVEIANN